MTMTAVFTRLLAGSLLAATSLMFSLPAQALPSYARQTGEECSACHVGGFGPQLTPHGIRFKVGGYSDSDGKDGHVPLSAMLVANSAGLRKGSPDLGADNDVKDNHNISAQEISAFLAGRFAPGLGSFAQVTYSGIEHKTSIDNVDIRYAHELDLGGQGATIGLSLNNNPTVQDPFNTLPAWRFPYTSPDLAPSGEAAPLIDGGLEQAVYGTTGYLSMDNGLYAELGVYNQINRRTLDHLNVEPDSVLDNSAPYARLAYHRDLHDQAFSLGLVGLDGKMREAGSSSGARTNDFYDTGVDASYQFLGTRRHIFTLDTSFIRERQRRTLAHDNGEADQVSGRLNQFNLGGSYYFDKTYGLSARLFDTRGTADSLYYSDGYLNGSPNTRGYTLQADWSPLSKSAPFGTWLNFRVGVQYTGYDRFNGASRNEVIAMPSGDLRSPSDNNTLSFFFWGAY